MKYILILFFWPVLVMGTAHAQETVAYRLHSHNDYMRDVPFWEAYASGCSSIEIDLLLMKGHLFVAHETATVQASRTLRSTYIEPIKKAKALDLSPGLGFQLLIDLKTEAYATLDALIKELGQHKGLWYSPENPSGIRIVISGSRPKVSDYDRYPDYIFFDYQEEDWVPDLPWHKIALMSFDFSVFSAWNGKGRMVEGERQKVQRIIDKVHQAHKPIRFWASPDCKAAWKAFHAMGVDYINTDKPFQASAYLGHLSKNTYHNTRQHDVYTPSFKADGKAAPIHNIILMIGDGNGLAQISAGMYANGNRLNLAQLKNIGFIKTQSADDFTTDSAAGGTALATGHKTNNRFIGMLPDGVPADNLPSVLAHYGFRSGLVTSDHVTGATPSAFYAHRKDRDEIEGIMADLYESPIHLFISHGKEDFLLKGINRLDSLQRHGFELVPGLHKLSQAKGGRVGCFVPKQDAVSDSEGRVFLAEATEQALTYLDNLRHPFFLMVEASMIDVGGHWNSSSTIIREELAFDQAIGAAMRYVDENPHTLLLVTADHETGGVSLPQGDISEGEVELDYQSYDHTGIMVPLFAYGPHSDYFRGVYENHKVFHKIMDLIKKYHHENH